MGKWRQKSRSAAKLGGFHVGRLAMAKVLGVLGVALVAWALARASITMAKADLWQARLAVKTLRKDQREAIAAAGEG